MTLRANLNWLVLPSCLSVVWGLNMSRIKLIETNLFRVDNYYGAEEILIEPFRTKRHGRSVKRFRLVAGRSGWSSYLSYESEERALAVAEHRFG